MLHNTRSKPIKLIETAFDILYLSTVLLCGALLLYGASQGSPRWQFGLMALILGAGDAFHLAPRVYAMWNNQGSGAALLGIGKLITSITMTVFYVILWHIGAAHHGAVPGTMHGVVWGLAGLRVLLCLFPQNGWTSANPPLAWAVWRNLPFFALGMLVAALFAAAPFAVSDGYAGLWLWVLISFAFYLPVVLFSKRSPKVGMLMLAKSCAYVAIVLSGFALPAV